jgi:hypothetical protein
MASSLVTVDSAFPLVINVMVRWTVWTEAMNLTAFEKNAMRVSFTINIGDNLFAGFQPYKVLLPLYEDR